MYMTAAYVQDPQESLRLSYMHRLPMQVQQADCAAMCIMRNGKLVEGKGERGEHGEHRQGSMEIDRVSLRTYSTDQAQIMQCPCSHHCKMQAAVTPSTDMRRAGQSWSSTLPPNS